MMDELITDKAEEIMSGANIIIVPDMAAVDLTAITKKELKLSHLDRGYACWNYWEGCLDQQAISGRGKCFAWDLWRPGSETSSEEVRKHFEVRDYHGHAGAFTQWCRVYRHHGHYASIPDDNGCWRGPDDRLCAPFFYFRHSRRKLDLRWCDCGWLDDWSFVAFHELAHLTP